MDLFEKEFDNYLISYDGSVKEIRFKHSHSYKVEELMEQLAKKLKLSKEEIKVAKIIGLLHDIGRFEEIKQYKKCNDVKSGVDHADESVIYLFDKGHIRDFIREDKYDQIIKNAIKNHNKYSIDKNISGKSLLFAKMIRDMDKVDIFRVLYEEFTYTYNKDEISEKVQESIDKQLCVDSHDIKNKTDAILSYCAFLYDINFKESFEILRENKNFEKFLTILTAVPGSEEKLNELKQYYLKYIEDVK